MKSMEKSEFKEILLVLKMYNKIQRLMEPTIDDNNRH